MKDSLATLEQLVLSAVVLLGDDAYGMSVHKKAEQLAEKPISLGGVYVTLDRLRAKGYLTTRETEPLPERGGRRKRCYFMSAAGARGLQEAAAAARNMYEAIDEVSWFRKKWGRAR